MSGSTPSNLGPWTLDIGRRTCIVIKRTVSPTGHCFSTTTRVHQLCSAGEIPGSRTRGGVLRALARPGNRPHRAIFWSIACARLLTSGHGQVSDRPRTVDLGQRTQLLKLKINLRFLANHASSSVAVATFTMALNFAPRDRPTHKRLRNLRISQLRSLVFPEGVS